METHQWINSILASAALVWAIYCHFRDRKPHINVNCTVLEGKGEEGVNDPYYDKKLVVAVTNTGSIPVLIVDVVVSFKQTNYFKKIIIKIYSDSMLLEMKATKRVRYSLCGLWNESLALAPCVRRVPVEYCGDSNSYHKKICDIKNIYAEDSLGNKWKANSKDVERINRKLFDVALGN